MINYYCREATEFDYSELQLNEEDLSLIQPIGKQTLVELARTHEEALVNSLKSKLKAGDGNGTDTISSNLNNRLAKINDAKARRITAQIKRNLKEAGYLRNDVSFQEIYRLHHILEITEYTVDKRNMNEKNYKKLELLEYHIEDVLLCRCIKNSVYETFDFEKASQAIPRLLETILSPMQRQIMEWYDPNRNKASFLSPEERNLMEAGCKNILQDIDSIIEPYRAFFQPTLSRFNFE